MTLLEVKDCILHKLDAPKAPYNRNFVRLRLLIATKNATPKRTETAIDPASCAFILKISNKNFKTNVRYPPHYSQYAAVISI